MAKSGNTGYETQKLYQKARQAAYRRLEALHHEEFLQLLHDVQHELGSPHIHRAEDHEHAHLNGSSA